MPEFLNLLPSEEALCVLLEKLAANTKTEEIDVRSSLGRVTSEDIISDTPLPAFPRSTVDGYAVRAADTHGASESLPAFLLVAGEVHMGCEPSFSIDAGKCGLIHTGGMLPEGCDAVVMIEHTQVVRENEVEVLRPVAVGENVIKVGEDIGQGERVVPQGTELRPAEIGGLMGLGINRVTVRMRPRVAILSSGDEVVSPDQEPKPGQVRDINSYTLAALVEENGGIPIIYGVLTDEFEILKAGIGQAMDECDLVVVTAGSSVSVRDLTARVINELGHPGVLIHGVNIRPGKPTILAICEGKPVIGLPGNPVSGLVIANLFVVPVIKVLQGIQRTRPRPMIHARLSLNLSSQAGREDWIPVQLHHEGEDYLAEPIFGKSNLIFTLVRADGLLRIPPDATGLSAGEVVQVRLL